jgi:hypothetical protein
MANIFSHYSHHKVTMNILDFNGFCADLKCEQYLPRGETMEYFFKKHARYDRSKGLFGVEFVVMLLDVAGTVAPQVPVIATKSNALEAFLGHFVLYQRPHPALHFTTVAELMQSDRSLSLELNSQRKALRDLFSAVTLHCNATAAASAAGKKKGATQAAPAGTATRGAAAAAAGTVGLTFPDLQKFCADVDLLGTTVPAKEVQIILDSAKRRLEARDDPPAAVSSTAFAEVLVALSMYYNPSPFVSLGTKFRMFLVDVLSPKVRSKAPALASALQTFSAK